MNIKENFPPIIIENLTPEINNGEFPVKCGLGEIIKIEADIFCHGHELIQANLLYKEGHDSDWKSIPMQELVNNSWSAELEIKKELISYFYTIETWIDPFYNWINDLEKKIKAKVQIDYFEDLFDGIKFLDEIAFSYAEQMSQISFFQNYIKDFKINFELIKDLKNFTKKFPLKHFKTYYNKILEIKVHRKAGDFSAWYEFFPRSQGNFRNCISELNRIKEMGFDVVYLPPIHPIGETNKKGKNNSLISEKLDIGSPWAIGNVDGGHKAIHPLLGNIHDFKDFIREAKIRGLEIAIDFALQCSPDHPYVKEHPEWFNKNANGKIKFAENPPKKYQDIYPLDFYNDSAEELWQECKNIVEYWIKVGIKIFRVDNPHTKPLRFWYWLINEINQIYPDVIFLAEAFTMPKPMKYLAKAGFTQSYTYFTWRNTKKEIIEYLEELTQSDMKYYFRGNFFVNTPDILPYILQNASPNIFKMRFVLAATLSSSYGMYSGYELCENIPLGEGKEEYLDSEKYELKHRDYSFFPDKNIMSFISRINIIRQTNKALQLYTNLIFLNSYNENIIAYAKADLKNENIIIIVINLQADSIQEDHIELPLDKWNINENIEYKVKDLLDNSEYSWKGRFNYIKLGENGKIAHIFKINLN